MVVKGITNRFSIARNGYGESFIHPCRKIIIQYCNWGGSSQGIRDFLVSERLNGIASRHKQIEFEVIKKSGHPVITGFYNNGRNKPICVRNMDPIEINKKLEILMNSSGDILRRWTKNDNVRSLNKSVRGIWSPFHGNTTPSL
ncbi:large ribosomal subunit protein mL43 [Monosporozyma unispora]